MDIVNYTSPIKLIVSDVDGTLVNEYKELTPRTQEAIKNAQAEGIDVAIASGRAMAEMDEILEKAPNIHYFICSNGAYVVDMKTGKLVYQNSASVEDTVDLLTALEAYDVSLEVYMGKYPYGETMKIPRMNEFINPYITELILQTRLYAYDLKDLVRREGKGVEKVQVFYGTQANRQAIIETFRDNEAFEVIDSSEGNIEFVPRGASKGCAVEALAKTLGLDSKNVMTMGDSNNDLSMLSYGGLSFAMENGEEPAKKTAKYLADSNRQEGAAKVIEFVLANNKALDK